MHKHVTKFVLLANIIAWPIAYFAMNKWLNNFAYRVNIAGTEFIYAGILTFIIALLTVSYQSVKAALSEPADSLRYE